MATMSIQLPESLQNGIENIAQEEGISISQFIISAVTEKISNLLTGQSRLKHLSSDIEKDNAILPYNWVDKVILQQYMNKLLNTLPVQNEPVDIELLQQEMRAANLSPNELSQSIIQAREE